MALPLFIVYAILDRDLRTEGMPNRNWSVIDCDDIDGLYASLENGRLPSQKWTWITSANLKDPTNDRLCPPGQTNLQLMSLAPASHEFWGVGAGLERGERNQERKRQMRDRLVQPADRAIPGFADAIVYEDRTQKPRGSSRPDAGTLLRSLRVGATEWGGGTRERIGASVVPMLAHPRTRQSNCGAMKSRRGRARADHGRARADSRAARLRERAAIRRETAESDRVTAAERAAARGPAADETRQAAKRLSALLNQTAAELEESAAVAEERARAKEQIGHGDAAAKERRVAERAREAAQRARSQAQEWLQLSVDVEH